MKTSPSQQKKKDTERNFQSFLLACCVYAPLLWVIFWSAPSLTYKPSGQVASVSLSFAQLSGGGAPQEEVAPEPQPEAAPEPERLSRSRNPKRRRPNLSLFLNRNPSRSRNLSPSLNPNLSRSLLRRKW